MELLPGVRADTAETDRLRVHHLEAGPADGTPDAFPPQQTVTQLREVRGATSRGAVGW